MVDAAAGELLDLRDGVALAGVDQVGGTERLGQLQLGLDPVDGDDAPGAGDGRTLDAVQPDAAAPDDRDRLARLDPGGAEDGAEAGHDATSDQSGPVERHVLVDLHQAVLVGEDLLGEARQVEELPHRLAVLGQPLRPGRSPLGVGRRAQGRAARQALLTVAAEHRQAGDHVVAGLDVADLIADRLDDARGLVPQHARGRVDVLALGEVKVAVAHAGGRGAHEHLMGTGLVDGDVLDLELAGNGPEYGGFHGLPPSACDRVRSSPAQPCRTLGPAPRDGDGTVRDEGAASPVGYKQFPRRFGGRVSTRRGCSKFRKGSASGNWCGEVVQLREGIWLHLPRWRT